MYLIIIYLPIVSAIVAGLMGRWIGREGVGRVTLTLMGLTWISAILISMEVVLGRAPTYIRLWEWGIAEIGLQFDGLTGIMLVVVTSISGLVHVYSTEYMKEDPHLPRFMSYLSLFTWFMLVLVTADNMLLMFVGWEGVGVCSYLLINFWWTRIEANAAAMQAMIMNRIGDVGLVVAMIICYAQYKTVNYSVIFAIADPQDRIAGGVGIAEGVDGSAGGIAGFAVEWIGYMILIGAMGKSAQIGLHTWLPKAMEGPTPVSALIHAATMVTAGVFVLLRCSPIIGMAPGVLSAIAIVGGVTALFAATVGLVQNDIKKVIAYSTCSQLGYMVLASGLGANSASIFHLFNHAFFKALLFLSAGSVIHAIGDEQDLRKMGGLIVRQPYTYTMMLVGSMALMGFPFLTGFYSKDAIIEMAYGSYTVTGTMGHWLGSISAMMTAFYSMRLINIGFTQEPQGDKKTFELAHEPSSRMSIPLVILGILSIFIGYVMKDVVMGPGSPFLEFDESAVTAGHHPIESEFIPTWIKWIPVILSFAGALYGMTAYPQTGQGINKLGYTFLSNKWHFDQIYNAVVVERVVRYGHTITYKILDRGLIEEVGPSGIALIIRKMSKGMSQIQSGQIYHYSLSIIIGTLLLILFT